MGAANVKRPGGARDLSLDLPLVVGNGENSPSDVLAKPHARNQCTNFFDT